MQKTNINPAIFQPFFESAANAGDKGQAQYFTPTAWGQALAGALPRYRPVIVDLTCGEGRLLHAAARPSTHHLLGCDIDPVPFDSQLSTLNSKLHRITGDLTRLYPLLRAVDFRADLFVLNPPWDLHWYREPLQTLANSDLPAVQAAFAAHDGRTGRDTIDSTIATLCLALDRCSQYGEGFCIANESTLQRLIFGPSAPHRALGIHIWAHVVIPGNICSPTSTPSPTFQTGVIYFAKSHTAGCAPPITVPPFPGSTVPPIPLGRDLRLGAESKPYAHTENTADCWEAVDEEWRRTTETSRPMWNLTLDRAGFVHTRLSLFDVASSRVTKQEAEILYQLEGRHPMQLVMQKEQRRVLQNAAFGKNADGAAIWRVDPALQAAVTEAVEQYHRVRAPLYPLSAVQRLGYLDECDEITCTKKLGNAFLPDHTYQLRSTTLAVRRHGTKLNLSGAKDDVEWDGQELAFFITDGHGIERCFMESRLRSDKVRVSYLNAGEKPGRQDERNVKSCPIDFTLQQLIRHFEIPDVQDVARINPAQYQQHLRTLEQIETLTSR